MPKITVTTPEDPQRTFETREGLIDFIRLNNDRANLFVDADGDVLLAVWDGEDNNGLIARVATDAAFIGVHSGINYPVRLAPVGTELKITQTEEC